MNILQYFAAASLLFCLWGGAIRANEKLVEFIDWWLDRKKSKWVDVYLNKNDKERLLDNVGSNELLDRHITDILKKRKIDWATASFNRATGELKIKV